MNIIEIVIGSGILGSALIWLAKKFILPKIQASAGAERIMILGLPLLDEITDQIVASLENPGYTGWLSWFRRFKWSKAAALKLDEVVDRTQKQLGIEDISEKRLLKNAAKSMLKAKLKASNGG